MYCRKRIDFININCGSSSAGRITSVTGRGLLMSGL